MTRFIHMDNLLGSSAATVASPRSQDSLRRVSALKKELRKLVHLITDEDECRIGLFDQIANTLKAFKDIKFKKHGGSIKQCEAEGVPARSLSEKLDSIAVPEHFLCPISSELMRDPVILATGQGGIDGVKFHGTYDRAFIQSWLQAGHRTCPKTQQVLPHMVLTPNNLIRNMIEQWCESQGLEPPMRARNANPDACTNDAITLEERKYVAILLDKLVASNDDTREAARELRILTKKKPSHRAFLGEEQAITLLVPLLSSSDSETQEHAVTTLLNLSIHDANKTTITDHGAIPSIVEVLRNGATMEARGNAAATLFSLSALDENKAKIGASGAIPALVDLLRDGNWMSKKDSASALFNLCIHHANKIRTVRAGLVPVLLKLIVNPGEGLVDESLAILAMVVTNHEGAEALGSAGAVPCLMGFIRDDSSPRNKENAVVILHAICANDRSYLKDFRDDECGYDALVDLSDSGTSRARRKAAAILDRLKKQQYLPTM